MMHPAWQGVPVDKTDQRREPLVQQWKFQSKLLSLLAGIAGFAVVVVLTFLGLLAITFFIGRVVPIDPVFVRGRRSRHAGTI